MQMLDQFHRSLVSVSFISGKSDLGFARMAVLKKATESIDANINLGKLIITSLRNIKPELGYVLMILSL